MVNVNKHTKQDERKVICCRDCILRKTDDCPMLTFMRNELDEHDTNDDDYCSHAEV